MHYLLLRIKGPMIDIINHETASSFIISGGIPWLDDEKRVEVISCCLMEFTIGHVTKYECGIVSSYASCKCAFGQTLVI